MLELLKAEKLLRGGHSRDYLCDKGKLQFIKKLINNTSFDKTSREAIRVAFEYRGVGRTASRWMKNLLATRKAGTLVDEHHQREHNKGKLTRSNVPFAMEPGNRRASQDIDWKWSHML